MRPAAHQLSAALQGTLTTHASGAVVPEPAGIGAAAMVMGAGVVRRRRQRRR